MTSADEIASSVDPDSLEKLKHGIATESGSMVEHEGNSYFIKVLGPKSFELERDGVSIEHRALRLSGELTVQEWERRIRESVSFVANRNGAFAAFTPISEVVTEGTNESTTVYIVQEYVDGENLDPKKGYFLSHLTEFTDIVSVVTNSLEEQITSRAEILRIPDILEVSLGDSYFRYQNFVLGSIGTEEPRIYLVDVYPTRNALSHQAHDVLTSIWRATQDLDTKLFDVWWEEHNGNIQTQFDSYAERFSAWYVDFFEGDEGLQSAIESIKGGNAGFLRYFYHESLWEDAANQEQEAYHIWFAKKKELEDKLFSIYKISQDLTNEE